MYFSTAARDFGSSKGICRSDRISQRSIFCSSDVGPYVISTAYSAESSASPDRQGDRSRDYALRCSLQLQMAAPSAAMLMRPLMALFNTARIDVRDAELGKDEPRNGHESCYCS
jgi:hypothetical protein